MGTILRTLRTDRTDFPVNAHTRVCARAHDARTRMYEAYTKKASEVSEVSETEVEAAAIRELERMQRARDRKRRDRD